MPNPISRYFGHRGDANDEAAVRAILQVGDEMNILSKYSKAFLKASGRSIDIAPKLRWKYIENETYAIWQKYDIGIPSLGVSRPIARPVNVKGEIKFVGPNKTDGTAKPSTVTPPVKWTPTKVKVDTSRGMRGYVYPAIDGEKGIRPKHYGFQEFSGYINKLIESPNFDALCRNLDVKKSVVRTLLSPDMMKRFAQLESGQAINYPYGGMLSNKANLFHGPFQVGGPHTRTVWAFAKKARLHAMFGFENGSNAINESNIPGNTNAAEKFAQLVPGGFADGRTQAIIMVAGMAFYASEWYKASGTTIPADVGLLYTFHNQGFYGGVRQLLAKGAYGKNYDRNFQNQSGEAKRIINDAIDRVYPKLDGSASIKLHFALREWNKTLGVSIPSFIKV